MQDEPYTDGNFMPHSLVSVLLQIYFLKERKSNYTEVKLFSLFIHIDPEAACLNEG